MRRRHPNPRLARGRFTYDVAEIARLYGCHRNTVRNWLKLGLKPIDDQRPALVTGEELNRFHASRRAAAKRPCGPAELYCGPCHKPQFPADGNASATAVNAKVWKVTGTCPDCGRPLTQRVGIVRLTQFRDLVNLSEAKASQLLGEAVLPSEICDFKSKEEGP